MPPLLEHIALGCASFLALLQTVRVPRRDKGANIISGTLLPPADDPRWKLADVQRGVEEISYVLDKVKVRKIRAAEIDFNTWDWFVYIQGRKVFTGLRVRRYFLHIERAYMQARALEAIES
jgi:hypothetical protein